MAAMLRMPRVRVLVLLLAESIRTACDERYISPILELMRGQTSYTMCILPLPFLLPLYIGSFCFPLTVNPSLFFTPCQPSPFPPSILQMFSIQIPYVAVTEIQGACLEQLSLILDQPVRVLDSCRGDWWLVCTIPEDEEMEGVAGDRPREG